MSDAVCFIYRNHVGSVAVRRVLPVRIWRGRTHWHPDNTWLMQAFDIDKNADRDFALDSILTPLYADGSPEALNLAAALDGLRARHSGGHEG